MMLFAPPFREACGSTRKAADFRNPRTQRLMDGRHFYSFSEYYRIEYQSSEILAFNLFLLTKMIQEQNLLMVI